MALYPVHSKEQQIFHAERHVRALIKNIDEDSSEEELKELDTAKTHLFSLKKSLTNGQMFGL